jgi:hypothetical protein
MKWLVVGFLAMAAISIGGHAGLLLAFAASVVTYVSCKIEDSNDR